LGVSTLAVVSKSCFSIHSSMLGTLTLPYKSMFYITFFITDFLMSVSIHIPF